jgi:lipoyl synthase
LPVDKPLSLAGNPNDLACATIDERETHMTLKVYAPGSKFPPISLSGTKCQLGCLHCDRAYLRGMRPAMTPEALLQTCRELRDQGAIGALLSGGSARDGAMLNLPDPEMVGAIRQAKAETGLILNMHPGLMTKATAQSLAGVIDFVSLEIPSTATIRDVFGMDATTEDYLATYHRLSDAGMHVVPHIAVYDGVEDTLLVPLVDAPPPETIVVIVFSPTRGTPMAEVAPPSPEMVGGVIESLVERFPHTDIALGCMRPRIREQRLALELVALDAGVKRMELPAHQTLEIAQHRGYRIERFEACCALPKALEDQVRQASR